MSFLGKLSLDAIPYHEPIIMVTLAVVAVVGLYITALITKHKKWSLLWNNWLTSVDHKRPGIMYIVLALVMLIRGFSDAIMMRTQQALATNGAAGYLPPEHYDQIFTAHGVIMIIFMAMPFMIGLMNLVVPLQIGARDVAFPFLNNLSFWLTASGAVLINISLGLGEFAKTGWVAYPPLSELAYSPGGWGRLLYLGTADFGHRDDLNRGELYRHRTEDACPRHEADANANLHLDLYLGEHFDRRVIPYLNRRVSHVNARPLYGFPLFHQ